MCADESRNSHFCFFLIQVHKKSAERRCAAIDCSFFFTFFVVPAFFSLRLPPSGGGTLRLLYYLKKNTFSVKKNIYIEVSRGVDIAISEEIAKNGAEIRVKGGFRFTRILTFLKKMKCYKK